MTEELFDVVDANDRVIDVLPRSVVHARRLFHRAVHAFLRNSRGELLLQVRSATKDQYPSCYTSSASGHVSSGQTYDDAMTRELCEELGLHTRLTRLRQFAPGPETSYEFTWLYEGHTDEVLIPDPEEIAALEWHSLEEIERRLITMPEKFSPCVSTLFRWYITRERQAT
jgi:isopentenyl-diphosphate Delta-isomerase